MATYTASIAAGQKAAKFAIQHLKISTVDVSPGTILMEGDSWFDYPADDLPTVLEEDYGYNVEKVSHRGDTLRSMATDPKQLSAVSNKLAKLHAKGHTPKAILLSAGGNDFAGKEFGVFINDISTGQPALNLSVFGAFLSEKIKPAFVSWITAINTVCESIVGHKLPIIIHGYDNAVPDGRGYDFGRGWLQPGFKANGRTNLSANKLVIEQLIAKFNQILGTLSDVNGLENVIHLDLVGTLSNGPDYKDWWANELHPSTEGFAKVAAKFHAALSRL